MPQRLIAIYLNDHLAGSVGAIEILEYLEAAHDGSADEHFFADIRENVEADQRELTSMMERLDVSVSRTRQVGARIATAFTELKLSLEDGEGGPLQALEALEVLTMGIDGKRSLWRAMQASIDHLPALADIDFDRLIERADEQRDRVEHARLDAAVRVFASDPDERDSG